MINSTQGMHGVGMGPGAKPGLSNDHYFPFQSDFGKILCPNFHITHEHLLDWCWYQNPSVRGHVEAKRNKTPSQNLSAFNDSTELSMDGSKGSSGENVFYPTIGGE